MAIQRRNYFSGTDQGPQSMGSVTVPVPTDWQKDLQSLEKAKAGKKAKTAKELEYANQRADGIAAKHKVDLEYRQNRFKSIINDNRLVAKAIDKNYQTELQNIENASKSEELKNKTIQSLIGTAKVGTDYMAAKAKVKAKQDRDLWIQEQIVHDEVTFNKRFEILSDKRYNNDEQRAEAAGMNIDEWRSYWPKGLGSRRALRESVQQAQAQSLVGQLPQLFKTAQVVNDVQKGTTAPEKVTLEFAISPANLQARFGDNVEARDAYVAQAKREFYSNYPGNEVYRGNPYAKKAVLSLIQKQGVATKTQLNKQAPIINRQNSVNTLLGHFQTFKKPTGDATTSWGDTVQYYLDIKADGVTANDTIGDLMSLMVSARRAKKITSDDMQAFKAAVIKARDKGGKETKLPDQFPKQNWVFFDAADLDVSLEEQQQQANLNKIHSTAVKARQNAFDRNLKLVPLEEQTTAYFMEQARIATMAGHWDLAKHIAARTQGPGSAFAINDSFVKETVKIMKLNNPQDFTEEWVDSHPFLSDGVRAELKKEARTFLPEKDSEERNQVDGFLDAVRGTTGAKSTLIGTKWAIDKGTQSAGLMLKEAENDFIRRTRANLSKDCNWNCAATKAYQQFDQEWQNGLKGIGKYAAEKVLVKGKKEYPYWKVSSTFQYTPSLEFAEAKVGLKTNKYYFRSKDTQVMDDKEFKSIVENWGEEDSSIPPLIWEFKSNFKDLDGNRYTQRTVINDLIEGYNLRNPDAKLKPIEETVLDQVEEVTTEAVPSVFYGPPSRELADIASIGFQTGWDFRKSMKWPTYFDDVDFSEFPNYFENMEDVKLPYTGFNEMEVTK